MKIAMAQINFLVGDLVGNADRMIASIEANKDVDLIVFSELSITGYPPLDLIIQEDFLAQQQIQIDRLIQASRKTRAYVLFGCVTKNYPIGGKPLRNTAILAKNGEFKGLYNKQLLPTYDIFDEARYFEPGGEDQALMFKVGDEKVGVLICEDCWNDKTDSPIYSRTPVKNLVDNYYVDYIVSLNASPSGIGKQKVRYEMFNAMAKSYDVGFIYVNQIGANDDVVFDGCSFIMDNTGQIKLQMAPFKEACSTFDDTVKNEVLEMISGGKSVPYFIPKIEFIYESLILGIRDYVTKCGFKSVVVGSSGGIDSAVVLALATKALGAENVKAITMPSFYSSVGSIEDSEILCKNLGIELFNIPITPAFDTMQRDFLAFVDPNLTLKHKSPTLEWENTQARIRGAYLMAYSNRYGSLVLSTGNKSEMSVGYFTLYGDSCGGLAVLADVYKTEVFELARYINQLEGKEIIPAAIIDKPPSAELSPDQKDTDSLPPYSILDVVLQRYIEGTSQDLKDVMVYARSKNLTLEQFEKQIHRKVDCAEFKRKQVPPGIRVREHAFGAGRRLPVARKV